MKFGQVWDIDVPDSPGGGILTVMVVSEVDDPDLRKHGVVSTVILEGKTWFGGGAGYPPGLYGVGDVGPVRFPVPGGKLVDDESP